MMTRSNRVVVSPPGSFMILNLSAAESSNIDIIPVEDKLTQLIGVYFSKLLTNSAEYPHTAPPLLAGPRSRQDVTPIVPVHSGAPLLQDMMLAFQRPVRSERDSIGSTSKPDAGSPRDHISLTQ